jgi:hypothetical protein
VASSRPRDDGPASPQDPAAPAPVLEDEVLLDDVPPVDTGSADRAPVAEDGADEPWDAGWLPQWVSEAPPSGSRPAEPAPVTHFLPPRLQAALAEFHEAELAAERAAADQAAARPAARDETIPAGQALAHTAVPADTAVLPSVEPLFVEPLFVEAPPVASDQAIGAVDVLPVPAAGRWRARVLLPLAVLLVAGLLAGFMFTSTSGDRPAVAAAEHDAGGPTAAAPTSRAPAPLPQAAQPVTPLADVVPIDVPPAPPAATTPEPAAGPSRAATRPLTRAGSSTADRPAPVAPATAPVPAPAAVPRPGGAPAAGAGEEPGNVTAGPAGAGAAGPGTGGTVTGGTDASGTVGGGTGSSANPPEGTGTDTDLDGTDDGAGEDGPAPVEEDSETGTVEDDVPDGSAGCSAGGSDTGQAGGAPDAGTGELAGACPDAGAADEGSPDDVPDGTTGDGATVPVQDGGTPAPAGRRG